MVKYRFVNILPKTAAENREITDNDIIAQDFSNVEAKADLTCNNLIFISGYIMEEKKKSLRLQLFIRTNHFLFSTGAGFQTTL